MRILFYLLIFLLWSLLGCQLSEVHLNELAPDTFERVIEQQTEGLGLTIKTAVKTMNGGVAIIGSKELKCLSSDEDAIGFLIQLDEKGIIKNVKEFSTTFPFCRADWVLQDVVEIGNGEFATCGYVIQEEKPYFYFSNDNSQVSSTTYIKEGVEGRANALVTTKDQGFIVVGEIKTENRFRGFMVKLNANSEVIWEKTWNDMTPDNPLDDVISILDIVSDEEDKLTLLSAGAFEAFNNIAVHQSDGTFINTFSIGNGSFGAHRLLLDQLTNGHYIIGRGESHPGFSWSEVILFDANWQRLSSTQKYPMLTNDLLPTADGGFLIFGTTIPDGLGNTTPNNAILIKIDSNGEEVWQQTYGGNLRDEGHQIIGLDNGGYMLIGINRSISAEDEVTGSKGIYIIRTDENGQIN